MLIIESTLFFSILILEGSFDLSVLDVVITVVLLIVIVSFLKLYLFQYFNQKNIEDDRFYIVIVIVDSKSSLELVWYCNQIETAWNQNRR